MIELLTTAEMAEADRRTIAGGVAGIELMENAGRSVADTVAARHPPGVRLAVVAGLATTGAMVLSPPASWPSAGTECGSFWSATRTA